MTSSDFHVVQFGVEMREKERSLLLRSQEGTVNQPNLEVSKTQHNLLSHRRLEQAPDT